MIKTITQFEKATRKTLIDFREGNLDFRTKDSDSLQIIRHCVEKHYIENVKDLSEGLGKPSFMAINPRLTEKGMRFIHNTSPAYRLWLFFRGFSGFVAGVVSTVLAELLVDYLTH